VKIRESGERKGRMKDCGNLKLPNQKSVERYKGGGKRFWKKMEDDRTMSLVGQPHTLELFREKCLGGGKKKETRVQEKSRRKKKGVWKCSERRMMRRRVPTCAFKRSAETRGGQAEK